VAVIPSSGKESDKGKKPTRALNFQALIIIVGPFNYETQMIPIVGLAQPIAEATTQSSDSWLGERHSARILQLIADELPGDVQRVYAMIGSSNGDANLSLIQQMIFWTLTLSYTTLNLPLS
jgi:hypothetical protein